MPTSTTLKKGLLTEVQNLPDPEIKEVIDYVRFLKVRVLSENETRKRFARSLRQARSVAKKEHITEKIISEEIKKQRMGL